MKKLLLIAMLALSPAAFAQDNAAKLALAREAISAMQADKMFDGLAAQFKQMAAQNMAIPASATPEQRQKGAELQDKALELVMTEAKAMIARLDAIYAEVYSEAELKAILAFYRSPEGQSMIAKQPQVMAKVMPLVQEMQQNVMPKVRQLVEAAKATP